LLSLVWFVFFFSSRRRHTRSYGDWSSDVCSSDLGALVVAYAVGAAMGMQQILDSNHPLSVVAPRLEPPWVSGVVLAWAWIAFRRSEERRVGKECRAGWCAWLYKRHVRMTVRCTEY